MQKNGALPAVPNLIWDLIFLKKKTMKIDCKFVVFFFFRIWDNGEGVYIYIYIYIY
jgi:hypothetical protein